MNSWRIHFGWAIVTALAVAVAVRVSSRNDPSPTRDSVPSRPAAAVDEAKPPPVAAPGEALEAPAVPKAEPISDEESLRARIETESDFEKLQKVFDGIRDRALKLKLLREAACSKDNRKVYAALVCLRTMKGRDVADVVEACLRTEPYRGYAAEAARMLGEIGDALSYAPLTEALRSKSEDVRVNSADSLRKLGYPTPAQDLAIAYIRQFESSDGALRKKSIETLKILGLEGSVAVFARALKDSNGDVRLEALDAFLRLDKKEYLPLLEPLVNDPNPEVAEVAKDVVEGLKSQDP